MFSNQRSHHAIFAENTELKVLKISQLFFAYLSSIMLRIFLEIEVLRKNYRPWSPDLLNRFISTKPLQIY